MKKRNIFTIALTLLMAISTSFTLSNGKSNDALETDAASLVGGATVNWNNVDYYNPHFGGGTYNVDGVPQDGFCLLVTYNSAIASTTYTTINLLDGGVSGCNVGDYILVNGVKSSEVADCIIRCYPTNGFYIYVPRASITLGEDYDYLTIDVLEGMSIDGYAQTEGNSFEYRGPMKTFGNWLKDPEPIVKTESKFNQINWDNRDYSPSMSQSWCGPLNGDGAPQNGYCLLVFFNEVGKTCTETVIGSMVTTGRGVLGNGDPVDHKVKVNGVNIVDVADSKCYIFPQYGLFFYIPDASLSNKETYTFPTIVIEEKLHFNNVNLPGVTFEFKGTLGKGGGWAVKKGPGDYNHFPFTGINQFNNNISSGTAGYYATILDYGVEGTDFLADNKAADATNRATEAEDIGKKLTINGLPIYKIREKYPSTKVGYDHGNNHLFVTYPAVCLLPTEDYLVPTLHIEDNAIFMDSMLPETTIMLAGKSWIAGEHDTMEVTDPFDFNTNLQVRFPHEVGSTPHAIFAELPEKGVELEFNFKTGSTLLVGNDSNKPVTFTLDGFYGFVTTFTFAWQSITLLDQRNSYATIDSFNGYVFEPNTDYLFELIVECGPITRVRIAINHFVVIDHEYAENRSGTCAIWGLDSGKTVIDYKKELPTYAPEIIYGGISSYDFNEGDPVYDFTNVSSIISLYDDSLAKQIVYSYEEGAVTEGKYNAGVWTLTILFIIDGYPTVTKDITINVHGKVSMAKISYDYGHGELVETEAQVGSHLTPPPNPETYHDDEFDYIFDGWYFEGFKWDFVAGVVAGDMHLEARFTKAPLHYVVSVEYEGIERDNDRFLVSKNDYLPFEVFEFEGATYEVYLDDQVISSLQVTEDVTIVVKYTVIFTYVEPKESTCTEDGNIGYYYSPVYGDYYFGDPNGREPLDPSDVFLPKSNHDIVHLDAKEPTCSEVGNIDCYYCNNCHKHFSDSEGHTEIENWSVPKTAHNLTHYAAKPATCTENGTYEYWTCANEPGVYYGDEECSFTLSTIVEEAIGHDHLEPKYEWKEVNGGYECIAKITCANCGDIITETVTAKKTVTREASCESEGQIYYSVSFTSSYFSAQTKVVNVAKLAHKYTFVAAVEATKDKDGVKEHYICNDCNKYFVKDGETYKEVSYASLIVKYKNEEPEKKGCGGSIVASSLIVTLSASLIALLVLVRRKEEK